MSEKKRKQQAHCHVCGKEFKRERQRVVDHDHFSGAFSGMAHDSCHLKLKKPKFVLIIAQISCKYMYYVQLFTKELSEIGDPNLTDEYLPMSSDTFTSFSAKYRVGGYKTKNGETRDKYCELRRLDFGNFMNSSLDALVKNVADHKNT